VDSEKLIRLEELAAWGQVFADRLGLSAGESRRVRWEISGRLLRYYTTLGLLDRAERLVGRTAYYCSRHLLQLLCIKSLQQRGLTLQQVQQELLGKEEAGLRELLCLPSDWDDELLRPPEMGGASVARESSRFWEQRPARSQNLVSQQITEIELVPGAWLRLDSSLGLDPELLRPVVDQLRALLHH
jgi:DNA-binding transcriptional MerR regulator